MIYSVALSPAFKSFTGWAHFLRDIICDLKTQWRKKLSLDYDLMVKNSFVL